MTFNPKDALDAAKDIATYSVEKASDIVENASDMIRGDIAGGVGDMIQNSLDIGKHAAQRVKEVFTGESDDDE